MQKFTKIEICYKNHAENVLFSVFLCFYLATQIAAVLPTAGAEAVVRFAGHLKKAEKQINFILFNQFKKQLVVRRAFSVIFVLVLVD